MEMSCNDPFGYLKKSGAIGVSHKAIAVSGSARGKGALGSSSVETKGLAKRANIEGNESAMYERLEKRSLKSLKEGGSEKELRQGHNDGGLVDALKKAPKLNGRSLASVAGPMVKGGAYKTPKVKPNYNPLTNPIKAAKQARRENVVAAKASGEKGAVKAAKQMGTADVRLAKGVRQARNDMGLRRADRMAGRAARKEARVARKTGIGQMV